MKTLIEFADGGEVLSVDEEPGGDTLEICVAIGPDWYGSTIGDGDTFFVTLSEDEVDELIQTLDQWLLERRVAREQAEDHAEVQDIGFCPDGTL